MKYESVTICHQLKRKTVLWECEDYLSSEKIYIYLQESSVQWLLIARKVTSSGLSKEILKKKMGVFTSFELDREIYDDYLNGRITKTICEAKNLNKLLQARDMALTLVLVENQDFGMINDACLTELTPEWVDENGEDRCTVGKFGKLLSEVFDRTPEAKRSKFSPFASYTGLSPFRMMLLIPSVRSFSFMRIRNFGLFVTLFEGDSLRIYFAPL